MRYDILGRDDEAANLKVIDVRRRMKVNWRRFCMRPLSTANVVNAMLQIENRIYIYIYIYIYMHVFVGMSVCMFLAVS